MSRQITPEEVKKHADRKSSWIIIHNDVYDVTQFLNEHPGGADALLEYAGKDGTQAFDDIPHSDNAKELMKKYKIGTVSPSGSSNHGPHCCCVPFHVTHSLQSGFTPYQKNLVVLPVTRQFFLLAEYNFSNECCTPNPKRVPKKTWRTYDGGSPNSEGSQSRSRSKSKDGGSISPGGGSVGAKSQHGGVPGGVRGPCQHCKLDQQHYKAPRPEDHVKSIIVPRESKLKWALIILASAIVVAIAVKKYKG